MKAKGFIQQSQYVITLYFSPPTARADLERLKADNAKTLAHLAALKKQMSPFWGKGKYVPRNAAERKLVAEHDKLKASLHRIPDFTTADASIFLSESVETNALPVFYSDDVNTECRQARQTVEAMLVRQVDASRADPEALMAKFAAAVDARDQKAMLTCFGVDLNGCPFHGDAAWVLRTMASLRLRDAMAARFGHEATEKALVDLWWLQVPNTKRIRATRWSVKGGAAQLKGPAQVSDGFFRISGCIMGLAWEQHGWSIGVSEPASSDTKQRNKTISEIVQKVSKEVKAGRYKTAEEVGEALRLMEQSAKAIDKGAEKSH